MILEEAWNGKKPLVSHLRVFGCIAYTNMPNSQKTKFEAKALKCLFFGYCEDTKAYRLMCLDTKKIIRYCDVTFCKYSESQVELEMPSSRRNDGNMVVVVDKTSTSILDGRSPSEGDIEDQPHD